MAPCFIHDPTTSRPAAEPPSGGHPGTGITGPALEAGAEIRRQLGAHDGIQASGGARHELAHATRAHEFGGAGTAEVEAAEVGDGQGEVGRGCRFGGVCDRG